MYQRADSAPLRGMRTEIPCPQFLSAPTPQDPLPTRHGALPRGDAERLLGEDAVAEALQEGEWVQPWRGVLVPAALASQPRTRASAALLRADERSVLSGATAVAVHGCGPVPEEVHLTVPYGCELRTQRGLVVRQSWIRETDVHVLDGLRVHALDVAIADLLCLGPRRRALDCLERALASLDDRAERFRALVGQRLDRRRDRRGTRQAGELLGMAWAKSALADSGLALAGDAR